MTIDETISKVMKLIKETTDILIKELSYDKKEEVHKKLLDYHLELERIRSKQQEYYPTLDRDKWNALDEKIKDKLK